MSLRSIGHWERGAARPSYAAFKLLRVLRHGELVDSRWSGFRIIRGKLVTPENHELLPADMGWLSLLVRRSAAFTELLRERDGLSLGAPRRRSPVTVPAAWELLPLTTGTENTPKAGAEGVSEANKSCMGLSLLQQVTREGLEAPSLLPFPVLAAGPIMGPQSGDETSQASTKQAQPSDAPVAARRSRSASRGDGGKPQRVLPARLAEVPSGEPEADSPFDCGNPCEEADTDAAGRVIDCLFFSSCEHLGKDGKERPVPLRHWSEVEALPRRGLKAPVPQHQQVLRGAL